MYLLAAALITAFTFSLVLAAPGYWWRFAAIIWAAVFLAIFCVYLPALYDAKAFSISKDKIVSNGGVFYKYAHSLPIPRIQYVSLITGPAQRVLGVCTVVVVAPGGKMLLSGLDKSDGESLVKLLTDAAKESEE